MTDKGIYEDFSLVRRRAGVVFIVVAILCVVALVAYWKIQILDYQKIRVAVRSPTGRGTSFFPPPGRS